MEIFIFSTVYQGKYYPRILVATSGCIGAGLDSSDVYTVVRDGFPSSILDFIQEMGRCGRSRHTMIDEPNKDEFQLIVTISSLVYMIERIFIEPKQLNDETSLLFNDVASVEEIQQFQLDNLISVVDLMFLHCTKCWHYRIEQSSVLQLHVISNATNESLPDDILPSFCNNGCPACSNEYSLYIKPVCRLGLTQFLVHTFLLIQSGIITPSVLVSKLKSFKDVGTIVYKHRTQGAYPIAFINSKVMQLIASKILLTKVEKIEEKHTCILILNIINEYGKLACEEDKYWEGFLLL
jgi:hypothetical protein